MTDHSNSPFLTGEVSKAATPNAAVGRVLRQRALKPYSGSIPRNSSSFKLSDRLNSARDGKKKKLAQLTAPYKAANPR